MTEARELTPEQIATALAEAQGYELKEPIGGGYAFWVGKEYKGHTYFDDPLTNNDQYLEITLDPEIHAGMIDVLNEWLEDYSGNGWNHNPGYLQDIRLWQLRAVVEYLRGQK